MAPRNPDLMTRAKLRELAREVREAERESKKEAKPKPGSKQLVKGYDRTIEARKDDVDFYFRKFVPRGPDKVKNNPRRQGPYETKHIIL
jgi:hypothetical protein